MPIEKVSSCFPLPVPGGPQQPARVAYVFDPSMEGHESMVSHPENPNRVRRIMENLTSTGVAQRCGQVPSRPATDEEVLTVHDASLLDIVKRIKDLKPSKQLSLGESLDSIYVNGQTETAARVALGSMLNLTDWVIQGGKGHSGLAVIRPPGHHAESDEPSGFCFFNNVAIAAQRALDDHLLKRVLVVDWDVHHGNGIQNAFLRDPRVLYISLHLFLGGSFYPGGQGGAIPVVGEGSGEGFNVNIPWEQTKMGDPEYIQAFLGTVLPICYEFNPELVLVSAGFDAAVGDPLGRCSVTPACYGVMTNLLCPLAEGKMVVALEGGYNLASISSAMTLCAKALLGDPPGRLDCNKMKQSATAVLRGASAVQAPFWRLVFRQPGQFGLPSSPPGIDTPEDNMSPKGNEDNKTLDFGVSEAQSMAQVTSDEQQMVEVTAESLAKLSINADSVGDSVKRESVAAAGDSVKRESVAASGDSVKGESVAAAGDSVKGETGSVEVTSADDDSADSIMVLGRPVEVPGEAADSVKAMGEADSVKVTVKAESVDATGYEEVPDDSVKGTDVNPSTVEAESAEVTAKAESAEVTARAESLMEAESAVSEFPLSCVVADEQSDPLDSAQRPTNRLEKIRENLEEAFAMFKGVLHLGSGPGVTEQQGNDKR